MLAGRVEQLIVKPGEEVMLLCWLDAWSSSS